MPVSVLIPWRSADPQRLAALEWVRCRLFREFPDSEIVVLGDSGEGPWCKAAAVQRCLDASTGGILVIHDGDVWARSLQEAVLAVSGGAPWSVPHRMVYRLSEASTAKVLAGENIEGFTHPEKHLSEFAYKGRVGGGCVVLRRDVYHACPMDARFTGWGGEDEAWGYALETLYGPPVRLDGSLFHLHHPQPQRLNRHYGNQENERLKRAYARCRGNPAAMRALIAG